MLSLVVHSQKTRKVHVSCTSTRAKVKNRWNSYKEIFLIIIDGWLGRPIRLFQMIDYENLSWFPTLLDRVTTTAWNYSVIIVVLWCLLKVVVIQLQVGLWIDAGSRFETEKNNGVAHFLEHMAFKVLLSVFHDIKLKKSFLCAGLWGSE